MAENNSVEYKNISDLPTLESVDQTAWAPVESAGKEGKKVDLNAIQAGTLDTTATESQEPSASESLNGTVTLHKVAKTGEYADLNNVPTIPTVGTLDTTTNLPLDISDSESLSGDVKLHQVAKKGTYGALNFGSLPQLDTANGKQLTTNGAEVINGKVLLHSVSKTGLYGDLNAQVTYQERFAGDGIASYLLPGQNTGGAYYDDDETGDVVLIYRFYRSADEKTNNACNVKPIYNLNVEDESSTEIYEVDPEYRHDARQSTALTKLLLLINNDGVSTKYAVTTFVLPIEYLAQTSQLLKVDVAMYDGTDEWNWSYPSFSQFIPLTCVSTLKSIDISKPGLIRVTGPVFEIVQ